MEAPRRSSSDGAIDRAPVADGCGSGSSACVCGRRAVHMTTLALVSALLFFIFLPGRWLSASPETPRQFLSCVRLQRPQFGTDHSAQSPPALIVPSTSGPGETESKPSVSPNGERNAAQQKGSAGITASPPLAHPNVEAHFETARRRFLYPSRRAVISESRDGDAVTSGLILPEPRQNTISGWHFHMAANRR